MSYWQGAIRCAVLACASGLLVLDAAEAQPPVRRFLTQEQLEEPARVVAWLKEHARTADRTLAASAHELGVEAAKNNNRGAAVKGFGESALRLPTPHALTAYVDARMRSIGPIRAYNRNRATHLDRDLRSFESLYRSALASDDVLSALNAQERAQTMANADCIAAYRRTKTWQAPCAPLHIYGLRRH